MGHGTTEHSARRPVTERAKIRRWRLQQFFRLGFDASQARLLADSDADLALTRRLVRSECDLETVLAIVL